MLSEFKNYIRAHEEWLMGRILFYARQRGYAEYTSTLREAWRLSISGLSASLIGAVDKKEDNFELGPHEDYTHHPASQFGIIEAERHRERGVSLDMFLGLMKYYRQSYVDLIRESPFASDVKLTFEHIINRFYDWVEIGFCSQWTAVNEEGFIRDLQRKNRDMTNEKNKYLTIFESLSMAVFIVDSDGMIENMNHAAAKLLNENAAPGDRYYGAAYKEQLKFVEVFPWMKRLYSEFINGEENRGEFEASMGEQKQYYDIFFSRSLDVSGKFLNSIVIVEEITDRKILEKQLEQLATTDPLTGAKNRRSFLKSFEQELKRSSRYHTRFALLMMDIDYFKKINDTFGHESGDKVLKLLVARSNSILRDSDIFGRWGGEEFIILLPETDSGQASAVADRLRRELEKTEVAASDGSIMRFTVSIGFTVGDGEETWISGIVQKADDALFMAKKQGRNCVVQYDKDRVS